MRIILQKLPTLSYWRRLSTTICALSAIVCLPGCGTPTMVEVPKTIPQTLLEPELQNSKNWSDEWLKLLHDAETVLNGAPKSTTH